MFPLYINASPYADNYLYENMLDFLENSSKYQDNITNGKIKNSNDDIIIGAFIESAYSVYEKEEEFTKEFTSCGKGCYENKNAKDILNGYHKFFYMYAIAKEITHVLLQNPQMGENIEYTLKNKHISYKWQGKNKLLINIDNEKIEFIKSKKGVIIKTDMKSLENYRLN